MGEKKGEISIRFLVSDDEALSGTSRVNLFFADRNRLEEFRKSLDDDRGAEHFILLMNGIHQQGAKIGNIETTSGSQGEGIPVNELKLDKYLRLSLRLAAGDAVEISPLSRPPFAEKIVLDIPQELSSEGGNRLIAGAISGRPVTRGTVLPIYAITGVTNTVKVSAVEPEGLVVVSEDTFLQCSTNAPPDASAAGGTVTFADVGGLWKPGAKLRGIFTLPLQKPDILSHFGVPLPASIIIHGPHGAGKTMMLEALCGELALSMKKVRALDLLGTNIGEFKDSLESLIADAKENQPAMLIIQGIDTILPNHGNNARADYTNRLILGVMMKTMEDLRSSEEVVIIAGTTTGLDRIEPELLQHGFFEHDIYVGPPDLTAREEILKLKTEKMPIGGDVNISLLAIRTAGFTGADIAALCTEAAYSAMQKAGPADLFDTSSLTISMGHFESALGKVRPSGLREISVQTPRDVGWDDIGGLDEAKRVIRENIVLPITMREAFLKAGCRPARGLLLFGPPGTGKTLLVKAAANECGASFIAVRGPELTSKWYGETERNIRNIFSKAREFEPSLIFFDELDSLAPTRIGDNIDRIVNQLLVEMDGVQGTDGVFVIGATNREKLIDPALLRPGRFDIQLELALPDEAARRAIFEVQTRGKPLNNTVDFDWLASKTDGVSGAEIAEICRLASMAMLRRSGFEPGEEKISAADFETAIDELKKSHEKKQQLGFVCDS